MKARTKIEKQVAVSNEKLTAISPKVLTWAVRKVAGHVCFRTSAHKCTCGDCGRLAFSEAADEQEQYLLAGMSMDKSRKNRRRRR